MRVIPGRSHQASPRFGEATHPAPRVWMHHLDADSIEALDSGAARLRAAWEPAR